MLSWWKKEQKEKKFKKQKKAIFSFLFFCLFLLILASSFRFYSDFKSSKIKDLQRVNFLVNSKDKLSLISISAEGQLIFLEIPSEKSIKLSRGFGQYPVSSIYSLGELERRGEMLLAESIQEYFGIPIEGVIQGETIPENQKELERILRKGIFKKPRTGFSKVDLLLLWIKVLRTPRINSQYLYLTELEQKKIDSVIGGIFEEGEVIKENLAVAVFNSTDFSGLAGQGQRLISNIGGRVISVGNSEPRETSVIKSSREVKNSYTLKRLIRIFQFKWEEGEIEGGRADIGVFLGMDYWKKLNEKW